eukprot:363879-Chlamydomonas_euryale.AAC.4
MHAQPATWHTSCPSGTRQIAQDVRAQDVSAQDVSCGRRSAPSANPSPVGVQACLKSAQQQPIPSSLPIVYASAAVAAAFSALGLVVRQIIPTHPAHNLHRHSLRWH